MIQGYCYKSFINKDGKLNTKTIVEYTTEELYSHGMIPSESRQKVCDIWIYPTDYFCPMDSTTGIITITERTVSIHHYDCSWMNHNLLSYRIHQLKNIFFRLIGQKNALLVNKLIHL